MVSRLLSVRIAVLNLTKNRSSPLYFLTVDTFGGILRCPKRLFTQNTFLAASDFFIFPAHKFGPEVVYLYLKFLVDSLS